MKRKSKILVVTTVALFMFGITTLAASVNMYVSGDFWASCALNRNTYSGQVVATTTKETGSITGKVMLPDGFFVTEKFMLKAHYFLFLCDAPLDKYLVGVYSEDTHTGYTEEKWKIHRKKKKREAVSVLQPKKDTERHRAEKITA